jgi:acylphosphatase
MGDVVQIKEAAERFRWAGGISDALKNLSDEDIEVLAQADEETLKRLFEEEIAAEAQVRRERAKRVEEADVRGDNFDAEAEREEEINLRDADMFRDK